MRLISTKLAVSLLTAWLIVGCGGSDDCGIGYTGECPPRAHIDYFAVGGNDPAVNGREQIVASFNIVLNCSYSSSNLVGCGVAVAGSGPIQYSFPVADIAPLISGNGMDLFIVLVGNGNGEIPDARAVPVTFRQN